MKRYLTAAIFSLAVIIQTAACMAEWPTHNSYMFSVFSRNALAAPFAGDMNDWWKRYGGEPESAEPAYYESNRDRLHALAKSKGDAQMLKYMRLLDAYLEASRYFDPDSWDYPSREDVAWRDSTMRAILAEASAYRHKKMRGQFALLTMRANMMLGRDKANMLYWTSTASKLPRGLWRDVCRNIYARALFNSGLHHAACEIYAEQGDMKSIQYCMRNYRNMAGIRKVYAEAPDSHTLLYLVQDLVNNYQETLDGDYPIGSNDVRTVAGGEAAEFVAFADSVLRDGKTSSPCLWQSAAAMVCLLMNDTSYLRRAEEAVKMDGSDRMKDNARCIRLLARAVSMPLGTPESSAWLAAEFRWLDRKIEEERGNSPSYANHYTDVKERIAYNVLAPRYAQTGNANMATALYGMMEENGLWFMSDGLRPGNEPAMQAEFNWNMDYSAWNEYMDRLKTMPADSLAGYYRYLTSAKTDVFEHYVARQVFAGRDFYNDLIGTRYIAEGRFADALKYLVKVPLDFLKKQNISWYMANRDYTQPRWFVRQLPNLPDTDGPDMGTPARNLKADFCKDILRLEGEYGLAADGAHKDSLAYALAVRYYQASHYGDCWFITHYGHSVNDSVSPGELDFAAEAARRLAGCASSADLSLRYKALYALASIPADPWFSVTYDNDYNEVISARPASRQYKALASLAAFASEHPQYTDSYTTRCDVLRRFMPSRRAAK